MTISIIIPMYNRSTLIGETLDSIRAQTYTDWECVVVDDDSTDDSKDVVRRYEEQDARIRLHVRPTERPKGATACRNFGFEISTGEFVYFFDSDDLLGPEFLRRVRDGMPPETDCAVFPFDGFENFYDKAIYRSRKFVPGRGPLFEQALTGRVILRTQTLFFHRSLLEHAGMLWRENFLSSFDDVDFTKRMMLNAKFPAWIDMPVSVHIRFGNTSSLVGETKRTPGKSIEDQLFVEREIYGLCCDRGLMTKNLHRGILRSLLRSQLIQALFHDNGAFLPWYGRTLNDLSNHSCHDKIVAVVSAAITILSPLLRIFGSACCRLPFVGKRFRRIRSK